MGSIFGKPKKKSRVTDQDRAVLQLKQGRDKIKQYQKKVYLNLEKERLMAKQLLQQGKKDRAKLLLRKKKHQEQILAQTDTQLEKLEEMVHSIEYAVIEVQVVEGLRTGNEALKKINELLSIEEIEKIMDETQESVEKQREIDALLSGVLTQEDEDDVLQELDQLVKDELPEAPAEEEDKMETELPLPDVPLEIPGEEKERTKERARSREHKERVQLAA